MAEKANNKRRSLGIAELAKMYGISIPVMRSWLNPINDKIGKRIGHKYTPKQIKVIFEHLDLPDEIAPE